MTTQSRVPTECLYRCETCGRNQVQEAAVNVTPPKCFEYKHDTNSFPDGGFVNIHTCIPHGPMVFERVLEPMESNPFADIIDADEDDPVDAAPF